MAESADRQALPAGSCDAHMHIFGPTDQYPVRAPLRYPLPDAPLESYCATAARLGLERFVMVQPSPYAADNSCLLDALRKAGDRARGIISLPVDASRVDIADLHAIGVRGVRLNINPDAPVDTETIERFLSTLHETARRIGPFDWSVETLAPAWLTVRLAKAADTLDVPLVLGHLGFAADLDIPDQEQFLERLSRGSVWAKISGFYRMKSATYIVDELVRNVVSAASDRLIWGSDFPHVGFDADDELAASALARFQDIVPDTEARERILVRNPARLFGWNS